MNVDNLTDEQIRSAARSWCSDEPGFEGPETFTTCGECIVCLCRARASEKGQD